MTTPALRLIPLVQTLRKAEPEQLRADLRAGLTTTVMLIPQAMAYALLAGLSPVQGLYAATLPTFIYALLGRSAQLAVGPVALDSMLVALAVAPLAGGDPVRYALLASGLMALVGAIQLLASLLRLGQLSRLITPPVLSGFTSAAALIIAGSQLQHALGLPIPRRERLHELLSETVKLLPETHTLTMLMTLLCLLSLSLLKRWRPRWPRHLLVVGAATGACALASSHAGGLDLLGAVEPGLPELQLPRMRLADLLALTSSALVLAAVGFVEAWSIGSKLQPEGSEPLRPGQELAALGAANLLGSVVQAYPVSGGFSRSAVQSSAGASTPLTGVFTTLGVVLSLLFLTPLFYFLPKAALAALILSAVLGLVDLRAARRFWTESPSELWVLMLTFWGTLLLGIQQGVALGILSSIAERRWTQRRRSA